MLGLGGGGGGYSIERNVFRGLFIILEMIETFRNLLICRNVDQSSLRVDIIFLRPGYIIPPLVLLL